MSLRAEFVRLGARYFLKRSRYGPAQQSRQQLRKMVALTPRPPAGTKTLSLDANVRADRISVPVSHPDRHVLFLHGGAYRAGAPANYRHFTWRIAAATHASVLAIDYRLAPEHPFPAALDDAVSAYRWLLDGGAAPDKILVMGDSAGGGLTLAALLRLRDDSLPLPAVALSPWTDLALTGASLKLNARSDPMLNVEHLPMLAQEYLAGADPRLPYISPLYGDLAGLPPILLQVGGDEILRDDAVRMHERLRDAGCQSELEVWPRMPHVWHAFAPVLPEARRAIASIGIFARRHLASRAADAGQAASGPARHPDHPFPTTEISLPSR
jgi:monoterpene epsilon-lactone hydrolase